MSDTPEQMTERAKANIKAAVEAIHDMDAEDFAAVLVILATRHPEATLAATKEAREILDGLH